MKFKSVLGREAQENDIIVYITRTGSSVDTHVAVVTAVNEKSLKVEVFDAQGRWVEVIEGTEDARRVNYKDPNGWYVWTMGVRRRSATLTAPMFVYPTFSGQSDEWNEAYIFAINRGLGDPT